MKKNKTILVVLNEQAYADSAIAYELLGKARQLGKSENQQVTAFCLGNEMPETLLACMIQYGAQHIAVLGGERLDNYRSVSRELTEYIKRTAPELVIFPNNSFCRAVAATISARVGAGLTADCIDIRTDDFYGYVFSRCAMGASVTADIACVQGEGRLCTVKPNVFHSCIRQFPVRRALGECIELLSFSSQSFEEPSFELQECGRAPRVDGSLENKSVIIAVGKGVSGKDVAVLKRFTDRFSVGLAGTRVLTEDGVLPKCHQVGQSGRSVAPLLYIAIGISGASQHVVGMQNSKKVIAVNLDRHAPIVKYADKLLLLDAHQLIGKLLDRMEEKANENN